MPRRASADGGSGIVPIQFFSKDSVVDEWQFVNLLCEFRLSNPKHSRSQKTYPKIMVRKRKYIANNKPRQTNHNKQTKQ